MRKGLFTLLLVSLIISCSSTPKKEFSSPQEALIDAVARHDRSDAEKILSSGVDINAKSENGYTALLKASELGNHEIIALLIKRGADVNAKSRFGWTSLMLAAVNGFDESVKILLTAKPDVSYVSQNGESALLLATRNNHHETVQLLKAAGAKR